MKYQCIVADPPWPYRDAGKSSSALIKTIKTDGSIAKGVAIGDYPVLTLDQIASIPVARLVAPSAHLYLWTTNAFMAEAHAVARAWGFVPKTILTWVKVHANDPARVSMKTGYYFRGATEHAIFAVRGSLPLLPRPTALPTAFLWPRQGHSSKPQAFFDMVATASPGPRLEMFARVRRDDWDAWGNEVESTVQLAVAACTGADTVAIANAKPMTPCERCGEPTETALCDACWKAYVVETVKQNVPVAMRQLGWQ